MARISAAPVLVPPFWTTGSFRWGVIAAAVLGGVFLLTWMDRENRIFQVERRLEEHPRLGPLARELERAIADAQRRDLAKDPARAERDRVPQALWLGRVREFREGQAQAGQPRPGTLYLEEPLLLAGKKSSQDTRNEVTAGRRDFVFRGARPRTGEMWLVSVWRDQAGISCIHHAERYDP